MRIEEWNINNNDQGGRKQIFYGWATVVGSLGLGNLGWTKVTYVVYPHR